MNKPLSSCRILFLPVLLLIIFLAGPGCLSLDPFLFKGEEKDSYEFDYYSGETECSDAIDSLGYIDEDLINVVELKSGSETVYAALLGDVESVSSSDTVILYFHGTSDHIDYYWPRTRLLYETGYRVMALDYRGYGLSSGEPTEEGIYKDGSTAADYIRDELGNPYIVVFGFSLGSLVACELASSPDNPKMIALVLEAPIGSVETLVEDATYLNIPGSYVTTYKGKNMEKIKNVNLPFLWLHGTQDETLPLESNGKPVWENYSGPESYKCIVPGAGHRTIPQKLGYSVYCEAVGDFISGRGGENENLISR